MAEETKLILSQIRSQIEEFDTATAITEAGTVISIVDGIARIEGLPSVGNSELLKFPNDIMGIALNLQEDLISAIVLGDYNQIKTGDEVLYTGRVAEVPVGKSLIGRVVDPTGQPLDGKGPIEATSFRPIERVAPNVAVREPVRTPVQTGIKAVDGLTPIGRGQRELIIGDRATGKTAIALDTIINQKDNDLICVYVAIGQKASKVAQVIARLEQYGAMKHTVVVVANASDSAALQYIAPYAGCAIGEEYMERGQDALVVYDDLTKHAWAYRQLSLLLRRSPGREAYPGDIFYLHSRLLERSAKYSLENGGGSLTALPIIETQAGDISAYVPTNVISITDGQIYLEADLFNSGVRPAINAGLSVSRVGSEAQSEAMKKVASRLRLELAQYHELSAFLQFGTDLDKASRAQITRGQRVVEILKQPEFAPVPLEKQVMILFAVKNGFLDDISIEKLADFEAGFHQFMETSHPEIGNTIAQKGELDAGTESSLSGAILEYKGLINDTGREIKQDQVATTEYEAS